MILLSIVIPCLNEEEYIQHCLESIIKQNEFQRGKVEIIVVNGGSTDNSKNIVASFTQQYSNARLINTSDNGLSMARNIGLFHSNGEYVMFVDADDWIDCDCLSDIISLALNNQPDIIIGLIEGIPEKDITKEYKDPDITSFGLNENTPNFLVELHTLGMKIAPSVKYIFKKTIAIDNQLLFPNVLHEDQFWSPVLLCYAQTHKLYPKYFYKYRLKNDGLSSNTSLSVANDYLVIANKLSSTADSFQKEKRQFLYHRCNYLLNKIHNFALKYTQEEKVILGQLMNKYDTMIFSFESYTLQNEKKNNETS